MPWFTRQPREDFVRRYVRHACQYEEARAAKLLAERDEAARDAPVAGVPACVIDSVECAPDRTGVDDSAAIAAIRFCELKPEQAAASPSPEIAGSDDESLARRTGPKRSKVPADRHASSRVRAGKKTPAAENQPAATISVSSRVAEIVADPSALVLLSQIIYWSRRGAVVIERAGWIHKTAEQWAQETGMTWKVQRRARRILLEYGLIEERLCQMPARLEFRLRLETLVPKLAEMSGLPCPDPDLSWVADRQQSQFGDLLGRSYLFNAVLTMHMPVAAAILASRLITATGQRLDCLSLQPAALHWVQLHRADWLRETGLSKDQWQTARRHLRELGLLRERQRNFPRRVDLAINLQAVRDLVAQPTISVEAEQTVQSDAADWAQQAGGIGHRPIPPAASPNPAHTDRPIPPTFIAHSGYYLLQGNQLQLPLQSGWAKPNWGGGLFNFQRTEALAAPADSPGVELIWPGCFEQGDREVASRHLNGLDQGVQQALLDEIDWQRAAKSVRSPVGLLRALCVKAREGTFIADGAHRIAGARRKRLERERQELAAQTAVRPEPAAIDQEKRRAGIAQARATAAGVRARGTR